MGDVWNGHHIMIELPRLYLFARNGKALVAEYTNNDEVHHNFHTPISWKAAHKLLQLNQILSQVQHDQQDKDAWTYIWGIAQYASSKFFVLNFKSIKAPTPFKWTWKAKVTKKINHLIG
jgi:hypothetical protein